MTITRTAGNSRTRERTHGASGALRALIVAAVLVAVALFGVSVLADGFLDDGTEFVGNETAQYNASTPTVETGATLTNIEYVGEPLSASQSRALLLGDLNRSQVETLNVTSADGGTIRYDPRQSYTASDVQVVYEFLPANGSTGITVEEWNHTTQRDTQRTATVTPLFEPATTGPVAVAETDNGTRIDVNAAADGTLGYNTSQVAVGDNVSAYYRALYDRDRVQDNSEQMLAAILPRLNAAGELAPIVLLGLVALSALAAGRRL